MGILSGYKKFRKYLRTADGYQLCSEWTKADSVEMADGSTLQESVSSLNEEVASLNEDITSLNGNLVDSLGGITFGVDADGNYGYIKAGADTVTPFKTGVSISQYIPHSGDSYRSVNVYDATVSSDKLRISITISCTDASQGCVIILNGKVVSGGVTGNASWSGNLVKGDRIQAQTKYNNKPNTLSSLNVSITEAMDDL